MSKSFTLFIIVFASLFCTNCGQANHIIYPTQISTSYVDSLTFEYDKTNTLDSYGSISVWVINKSNNCFVFPYDYGISFLIQLNGMWVKTPSIPVNYSPHDDIIMEKQGKALFDSYPITFYPDISNLKISKTTEVKGIIKGYVCDHPEILIEKEIPFYVVP
jgi:hypothetical protein